MNVLNIFDGASGIQWVSPKEIEYSLCTAYEAILRHVKIGEEKFEKKLNEVYDENNLLHSRAITTEKELSRQNTEFKEEIAETKYELETEAQNGIQLKNLNDALVDQIGRLRDENKSLRRREEHNTNENTTLKELLEARDLQIDGLQEKYTKIQADIYKHRGSNRQKIGDENVQPFSNANNNTNLVENILEDFKENFTKNHESQLECSICNEMFIFSTTTSCGHLFCDDCIETWNAENNNCPVCRSDIKCLTMVKQLDNIITIFVDTFMSGEYKKERLELVDQRKNKLTDRQEKSRYTQMEHRNERELEEHFDDEEEEMESGNSNEDIVDNSYGNESFEDIDEPFAPYNDNIEIGEESNSHGRRTGLGYYVERGNEDDIHNIRITDPETYDINDFDEYEIDRLADHDGILRNIDSVQDNINDNDILEPELPENNTFENSRRRFRLHVENVRASNGLF